LNRNETPALPSREGGSSIRDIRVLRKGNDVTIAATGLCVAMALEAADGLAAAGISAEVLDVACIKPLDTAALAASVSRTGRLVTAEEHNVLGGLAGACAEALASEGVPFSLARIGVQDCYTESGPYTAILAKYGISTAAIRGSAEALVNKA
jgi:transketolase